MKTLYIHAGTPKTGTTALQDFLPDNQAVLNRFGFVFPEVPIYFRGVAPHQTAHFLSVWEPDGTVPEQWDQGFDIVEKALGAFPNVIISDEQVWWRQHKQGFWEAVTGRVRDMDAVVKVIVYLRRQDDQIESFYNEKVKGMPKLTMTFSEYLKSGENDYFPLDYASELDRFSHYLGKENVIVRSYEKGNFKGGNIFADFLDAIGLSLTDEYVLPSRHANTRWPEHVIEVKRMLNAANSYHRRKVPNFYRDVIEEAYGIGNDSKFPPVEYGMFSGDERTEFMSRYEEGNSYVAREYLHRSDGVLFYDKPEDLPKWSPDETELIEDTVKILAGADVYLYRQADEVSRMLSDIRSRPDFKLYDRLKNIKKRFKEKK